MNDAHRIADIGKNVYILYVAELVQDSELPLSNQGIEKPRFFCIVYVCLNKIEFSSTFNYSKKVEALENPKFFHI